MPYKSGFLSDTNYKKNASRKAGHTYQSNTFSLTTVIKGLQWNSSFQTGANASKKIIIK